MKNVAVIFGGRSAEHDISVITGQFVIEILKASDEYEPVPIYIAKDNKWYSNPKLNQLDTFRQQGFDINQYAKHEVALTPGRKPQLVWIKTGLIKPKAQDIDVVFPTTHGTYGEDGSLMGQLRLANVPFVGCGLEASVIAMDKVLTKTVTEKAGVPSVPYTWFYSRDWQKNKKQITAEIKKLKSPWFVKPAHLGSSIGVTRVDEQKDLENAIEVAMHFDDKVIVEQGITDMIEINCAMLGNDGNLTPSVLEQPVFKGALLGFEDKYIGKGKKKGGTMGGKSNEFIKIPAPIPSKLTMEIQNLAKQAYEAIGGSGTARLDFMVDNKTKKPYLNEINPLPGTLHAHLWKESGVSNIELVDKLIKLAEDKFNEESKLTTTFSSSVLSESAGSKSA